MAADGQSGCVGAITTYEIFMEAYVQSFVLSFKRCENVNDFVGHFLLQVEQLFLHSLWIPDWRTT